METETKESGAIAREITNLLRTSISNAAFKPPNRYAASLRKFIGKIIALDGIPCAGKTHLGRELCNHFLQNGIPAVFLEEKMNKEHLGAFYRDQERMEKEQKEQKEKPLNERKPVAPNKYAFDLQIAAMFECIILYKEAWWYAGRGPGGGKQHVVILDRPIWGNRVFEQHNVRLGSISPEQHAIYDSYVVKHGPYVFDHLIYLYTSPEKAHYRMLHVRKNKEEKNVSLGYLEELEGVYYTHLHQHIEQADEALVVIPNEDAYCNVEHVIDTLSNYRVPPKVTSTIEEILKTPGEITRLFKMLCNHYCG